MTARDPRGTAPESRRRPTAPPVGRRPADDVRTGPWPSEEPPVTTTARDWRSGVMGAVGLNVVAGVWLIISPWVVGYTDADAWWNPIISGAIVTVLAFIRIFEPAQTAMLSAVNAAIGVWLFVSGFWLADSGQASWNVWILGIIVFVLAAIALSTRRNATA